MLDQASSLFGFFALWAATIAAVGKKVGHQRSPLLSGNSKLHGKGWCSLEAETVTNKSLYSCTQAL